MEKKLDERLDLAYDERLGYLTHCPTNLGTAMRASVMMFLPAITWAREMGSLQSQLAKIGLTVRGAGGEGSTADGCLYQISNRVTLGVTEEDTVRKLNEIAAAIAKRERKLRSDYPEATLMRLRDRVRRSLGTLTFAELLSTEEFMQLYTDVRLGVALGICDSYNYADIDSLLAEIRPASLALSENKTEIPSDSYERDKARASLVREKISR